MTTRNLSLRPESAGDAPFLRHLIAESKRREFAGLGLPEPLLEPLLASQVEAYLQAATGGTPRIIEADGVPVGRLACRDTGESRHLTELLLLPERCGQGLGTALLRQLQARTATEGRFLTLQVAPLSPARRLYRRLGFGETGLDGPLVVMRWPAGPMAAAPPSPAMGQHEAVAFGTDMET